MPREVHIEGWFRQLQHERLEIFLKYERGKYTDYKIRASGPPEFVNELVDHFEQKTGLRVNVPWRLRVGPKPIEGQIAWDLPEMSEPQDEESPEEGVTQLSSQDATVEP